MIDRKTECINRIDELIKFGNGVLLSKSMPIEKINRNRMNAMTSDEALFFSVASHEEKQEFYDTKKQNFTKTYSTIDYNYSLNWTIQVHSCIVNYLGTEHYITNNIKYFTDLNKVEKNHVEKIISILNGIKVAVEKGDINIEQRDVNYQVNCKRCHYLIYNRINNDVERSISADAIPAEERFNLIKGIPRGFGLEKDPTWIDCHKKVWKSDNISTYEQLEQIISKDRNVCPFFSVFKDDTSLEALLKIDNEKRVMGDNNMKINSKLIESNKIFIVHGHDNEAKAKMEAFIRKIDFDPIILSEQASGGRTIIEKIEKYTDVGFGIVLYTPCDKTSEGKLRARQNVLLEHGFLMGKLGRAKVCALVKGDVEKPSDIDGIVYIDMDDKNAWELRVVKELQAAGYDADANKL